MTSRSGGTAKRIAAGSPAATRARRLVGVESRGSGRCTSAAVRPRAPPGARASSCLRRAEAVVRAAARDEIARRLAIELEPLGLPVRRVRPADVRALVPVEAEPAQVVENRCLGLARRSLGVGVLDAQDERAAVAAREQPVEQRRARVADVQLAGRTRREPDAQRPHRAPARTRAPRPRAPQSPRRGPTASTPSFVLPLTLTAASADAEHAGERARIAIDVRRELRPLEDDGDVDAGDRPAAPRGRSRPRARAGRARARPSSADRCSENAGRCRRRPRRRASRR